jgi:hypothetical protein
MKGNRGEVEKTDKRRREDMLARMLLHVMAATVNVNQTVNAASLLNRSCIFENVEDLSVVSFDDFGYAQSVAFVRRKEPARVENLAAAGGIEGGAIQNDGKTRIRI